MFQKMLNFGLVGFINTLVDFIIYAILVNYFGWFLLWAHLCAWVVTIQLSFMMNSLWTWQLSLKQSLCLERWILFMGAGLIAITCSSLVLMLFSLWFSPIIAKFFAILAGFGSHFLLSYKFIFARD